AANTACASCPMAAWWKSGPITEPTGASSGAGDSSTARPRRRRLGGGAKEAALVGVLIDGGGERPLGKLLMPREPDIGRAGEARQQLVEHRADQRPPAELAMDHHHDEPHRLVRQQIVE